MNIYICIYIYTYIHMYVYIYICTYTRTCVVLLYSCISFCLHSSVDPQTMIECHNHHDDHDDQDNHDHQDYYAKGHHETTGRGNHGSYKTQRSRGDHQDTAAMPRRILCK